MENGKVFIWMNLLGFERTDPDRGVKHYLDQTGFIPGYYGIASQQHLQHTVYY